MKKKLLNVITSLDPADGGVVDGPLRLSEIWRRWGVEVDFVTLDMPRAPYLEGLPGIHALGTRGDPARPAGPLSYFERLAYSPALVPWLRRHAGNYDAVIVHLLWNYATLASRRALVGGRTPYYVFPHGSLDPWFKEAYPRKDLAKRLLWPFNEGRLCNAADAVLFTTEEERLRAQDRYQPYRVNGAVVGFGSSDVSGDARQQEAAFRAAFPALGDRRYLLFLSRIHPKKGCDLLIEAFGRIAAQHPDLDLVMAGPDQIGWQAELQAIADRHGAGQRVHWTGMISGDVKWGAYRGCEAFTLTSHTENFGMVVAEALACGKPVLITDKVNVWREVDAAKAGWVVSDTSDAVNGLIARFVAADAAERALLAGNARACYDQYFRMETAAANVLDLMGIKPGAEGEPAAR